MSSSTSVAASLSRLVSVLTLIVGLSACTTKLTPNPTDTTSSTTPGAYFNEDGLLRAEQKVNAFVDFNYANVRDDMARGSGEYLASLGSLMGVQQDHRAAFSHLVREKYAVLYPSDETKPREVVTALYRELRADPVLARYAN